MAFITCVWCIVPKKNLGSDPNCKCLIENEIVKLGNKGLIIIFMAIMQHTKQDCNSYRRMGSKCQFLTCLLRCSKPTQFNWDQVITQKAILSALLYPPPPTSVPHTLLSWHSLSKTCHKRLHLTEKNNLSVITPSLKSESWNNERILLLVELFFSFFFLYYLDFYVIEMQGIF